MKPRIESTIICTAMAASSSPAIRATRVTPASRITRRIVVEERSANAITT